ncbi:MAG: MnhB domain-containing protein [Bacteroidota bacterium]|nr:MnhB domain-containing protein [Bacteroidota bacterium]
MKGMTIIVKKTTQLIVGMVFMYGIYVIVHGHLTPGGGFAGGVVIAGSLILVTLANGGDFLKLVKEEMGTTIVENLATILVIMIAASGFLFGTKAFFNNYLPKGIVGHLVSAGVLPLYNIFVGAEVAASIFIIFLSLMIFKEESPK